MKICKQCGKEFTPIKNTKYSQKFCSRQCDSKFRYENSNCDLVTCKNCGQDYTPKVSNRKSYCSRECYFASIAKKCKICGKEIIGSISDYCSQECKEVITLCVVCGEEFKGKTNSKYCSEECYKEKCKIDYIERKETGAYKQDLARQRVKYIQENNIKIIKISCIECGNVFSASDKGIRKFCCKKCINKNTRRQRRAREKEAYIENISMAKLFERDKGTCQLCGKKVNYKYVSPHPKSATIDHIVPLSLGGLHEYSNVQLAHMICNSLKGNGFVKQGEQLRIF